MADRNKDLGDDDMPEPIDDGIRVELSLIYRKANDALLFAKAQQWWTVGSTLVAFVAILVIAKMTGAGSNFIGKLTAMIILMACAASFMLVIYQFWQHNELLRIEAVVKNFSPLFQKIHGIKSKGEGNFHRYTLLAFMLLVVILGAMIAYLGLKAISRLPV